MLAREQYYEEHPQSQMKIHLVDGRNYTATYGYAVVEAAKMLARGASVPELIDYMDDVIRNEDVLLQNYDAPILATIPDLLAKTPKKYGYYGSSSQPERKGGRG